MAALTPMTSPAYYFSGGDIVSRGGGRIHPRNVRPILKAMDGERALLIAEGDKATAMLVFCAGLQLIRASRQQARWARCMDRRAA